MKNRSLLLALAILAGTSMSTSSARAGVTIVGGLSNFDCTNTTGKPENEFEIEFPSLDPAEIVGFWANTPAYKGSGYGNPTEVHADSSDGIAGHKSVYVNYKQAGIFTPANFTEHFGVHFANALFTPTNTIYRWLNNGVVSDVSLPTVSLTTTPNLAGGVTITPNVANTTPNPIVVTLHTTVVTPADPVDGVRLDNLVDSDPAVQQAENENEPGSDGNNTGVTLQPGEVLGIDGEAHDPTAAIITNPAAWLATHQNEIDGLSNSPNVHGLQADLNNNGDSVITTLSVTDANGNPITNIFSAVNTANPKPNDVPEPASLGLLTLGTLSLLRRRR